MMLLAARPSLAPSTAPAPTPVPESVLEALRFVRKTRLIDMADRETVMLIAAVHGHWEAMEWLVEHREVYFRALAMITTQN
jgi:hypothetical protein